MERTVKRFTKVYPWYGAFTSDLLFYIAIDTLFLSLVKNFTAAEIVSVNSIAQLVCIGLQFPLLFVIKKIGNTASFRVGAFCLLLSSVLITFGQSYFLVLLGRIFHDAAAILRNASVVALENNLELTDSRSDFVRLRTASNTAYSFITMLIAFVASYMFNLNNYLPMFGCIACCAVGFILSLLMKDSSAYNRIPRQEKTKERVKIHYSSVVIIIILVYSIAYLVIQSGQGEGKLFIQQNLLLEFSVEDTALIIGAIVAVSRVIRVISNMLFARLYVKYQAKIGVALAVMLGMAIGFMLFGSLIPDAALKIVVMGLGYTIILFARDPFTIYIQDVLFASSAKEEHQTLLAFLSLGMKLATAGAGLVFAAILVSYPMILVISIIFAIAISEIVLSVILYGKIVRAKAVKAN